jgi:hypothetical protein
LRRAPHRNGKSIGRALLAGAAVLVMATAAPALGAGQQVFQSDDAPPPAAPWCQSAAPEASPDSLSLSMVYVPSEYAQVKARTILQDANYEILTKEMAADLGVPPEFVTPNSYLVRAGGFFQPEGRPDRSVQAYFDPGDGLLQINTYAASTSNAPINWAAVVVAPGEVNGIRSICVPTGG